MEDFVLVQGGEYLGKYVALASFFSKDVIASGDDLSTVASIAKDHGIEKPVIIYVPEKDAVNIYAHQ
ncbi:DUF5678 domain-containing protein [Deltaproteobacteria bacterium TL4]